MNRPNNQRRNHGGGESSHLKHISEGALADYNRDPNERDESGLSLIVRDQLEELIRASMVPNSKYAMAKVAISSIVDGDQVQYRLAVQEFARRVRQ